jgi:hypothetical protein
LIKKEPEKESGKGPILKNLSFSVKKMKTAANPKISSYKNIRVMVIMTKLTIDQLHDQTYGVTHLARAFLIKLFSVVIAAIS